MYTVYIVKSFTIKFIVKLKIRKKKNAVAFFDFNNPIYNYQTYEKRGGGIIASAIITPTQPVEKLSPRCKTERSSECELVELYKSITQVDTSVNLIRTTLLAYLNKLLLAKS